MTNQLWGMDLSTEDRPLREYQRQPDSKRTADRHRRRGCPPPPPDDRNVPKCQPYPASRRANVPYRDINNPRNPARVQQEPSASAAAVRTFAGAKINGHRREQRCRSRRRREHGPRRAAQHRPQTRFRNASPAARSAGTLPTVLPPSTAASAGPWLTWRTSIFDRRQDQRAHRAANHRAGSLDRRMRCGTVTQPDSATASATSTKRCRFRTVRGTSIAARFQNRAANIDQGPGSREQHRPLARCGIGQRTLIVARPVTAPPTLIAVRVDRAANVDRRPAPSRKTPREPESRQCAARGANSQQTRQQIDRSQASLNRPATHGEPAPGQRFRPANGTPLSPAAAQSLIMEPR